jgi:chemotaxis protein MotA
MNIPIGWIIAVASCVYGFMALGGEVSQLWVPAEYLIILGAASGALIAGNKGRNLKNIAIAIGKVFVPASVNKQANTQLLSLMFELLQRIKRDGRLSIDSDVEEPDSSVLFSKYPAVLKNKRLKIFLRDYLRLIVDGNTNPSHIETVMSQEIDVLDKEAREPSSSLLSLADSLPAFGIVAAITGVIHTLSELKEGTDPGAIGVGIASALVGTLLGVFAAYAVVGPVANTLRQLADAELRPFEAVKEIVVAYYSGFSAPVAVEYGRKVLFSDQRPTMDELEQSVMATSGQPFRDR